MGRKWGREVVKGKGAGGYGGMERKWHKGRRTEMEREGERVCSREGGR